MKKAEGSLPRSEAPSPQRYWNEPEAARKIGISRATLLRKRQNGEIRYFRVGTRVVYSDEHIGEFLARCERRDVEGRGSKL